MSESVNNSGSSSPANSQKSQDSTNKAPAAIGRSTIRRLESGANSPGSAEKDKDKAAAKGKGRVRFTDDGDEAGDSVASSARGSRENLSSMQDPRGLVDAVRSAAQDLALGSGSGSGSSGSPSPGRKSSPVITARARASIKSRSPLGTPPLSMSATSVAGANKNKGKSSEPPGDYFSLPSSSSSSGGNSEGLSLDLSSTSPSQHQLLHHSQSQSPMLYVSAPDSPTTTSDLSKRTMENTLRNKGQTEISDNDIREQHKKIYGSDSEDDDLYNANDDDNESDNSSENGSQAGISVNRRRQHGANESSTNLLGGTPVQPAPAIVHPLTNILDVGTKTSGGLAPGAYSYEEAQESQQQQKQQKQQPPHGRFSLSRGGNIFSNLLERRHGTLNSLRLPGHQRSLSEEDPRSQMPTSDPSSVMESPSSDVRAAGHEMIDGDIPLLDLDKKLLAVKHDLDPEASEVAKLLVETHVKQNPRFGRKRANALIGKKSGSKVLAPNDFNEKEQYSEEHGFVVPNVDYLQNLRAPEETTQANPLLGGGGGDVTPSNNDPNANNNLANSNTNANANTWSSQDDYVAPPTHVKQGVLGSLLKLYAESEDAGSRASGSTGYLTGSNRSSPMNSEPGTPVPGTPMPGTPTPGTPFLMPSSGTTTPSGLHTPGGTLIRPKLFKHHSDDGRGGTSSGASSGSHGGRQKWYKHKHGMSSSSLGGLLIGATHTLAAPGAAPSVEESHKRYSQGTGGGHSKVSAAKRAAHLAAAKKRRLEEQIRITVHIADVLQRQRFILRLCRALMLYGAPTHRLEEYMKMTSRVLEIDGQFIFIPGCMICSFGDSTTHTSEMQLVRCVQGLNLSKLHETHLIYKEVVHDVVGVEDASQRLDELLAAKNFYRPWQCILFFGLASAMCAMYAFKGGWSDLPISLFLGSCVGFLQIWVAPRSDLYSNVFEVSCSIIVSFLGRAFGSIGANKDVFCFSAVAQGSLALILPGYIILCGSLELQSRNMVAGSVRMFYAIIYSLFLGFGITLGSAIYGWIDTDAVDNLSCKHTLDNKWKILFIPCFTVFVGMVNQASFRQLPIMILISSSGYTVTYFVGKHVSGSSEFTSAIGAFVIGILGNIYSRIGHGLAFAAMLPAIFVQVPSGVASQGSLISGLETANQLVHADTSSTTTTTTATATSTDTALASTTSVLSDTNALNLGITMIQVSIGITVGLFMATLVIYPFGKKRSGLFTF